jgi:hypothetical protein
MADRDSAVESGVRRTSNLFVDGERYQGAFNPEAIARVIRRHQAMDRHAEERGLRAARASVE